MKFKASFDKTAWMVTIAVTSFFICILVMNIIAAKDAGNYYPFIISFFLLAVYAGTYFYHPFAYRITEDELIIERPLLNVTIPRNEIKDVKHLTNNALAGSVRIFGVGGLFGYFGKFTSSKLGQMTWYATKRKSNIVLIKTTTHKKIVVTPDEAEKFTAALTM